MSGDPLHLRPASESAAVLERDKQERERWAACHRGDHKWVRHLGIGQRYCDRCGIPFKTFDADRQVVHR